MPTRFLLYSFRAWVRAQSAFDASLEVVRKPADIEEAKIRFADET